MSSGQFGEIHRDVIRTFQSHPFFQASGQGAQMLDRVLKVLLLARPLVGYCQGMNFVVANLILARIPPTITGVDPYEAPGAIAMATSSSSLSHKILMTDKEQEAVEVEVFEIMCLLIDRDGPLVMGGLWCADIPKMKLRVYQMDRLMQWTYPKLHAHFQAIQLAPEMLVAQWFLTIFSYTIPTHITHEIWDFVYFGGWPAMFRIALSILHYLESSFIDLDLEGIGLMMRDWKKHGKNTEFLRDGCVREIMNRAKLQVVNDEILQQLQESFAMEMITLSESSLQSANSSSSSTIGTGQANALSSSQAAQYPKLGKTISSALSPFIGRSSLHPSVDSDSSKRSVLATNTSKNSSDGKWLSRYGDEVPTEVASEMIRIRDDILLMERQIDIDKQLIQVKLVKACERYREVEDQYHQIADIEENQRLIVEAYEQELRQAIARAQYVAQSIAQYYDRVAASKAAAANFPNAEDMEKILEDNRSLQIQGLAAVDSFTDDESSLHRSHRQGSLSSKTASDVESTSDMGSANSPNHPAFIEAPLSAEMDTTQLAGLGRVSFEEERSSFDHAADINEEPSPALDQVMIGEDQEKDATSDKISRRRYRNKTPSSQPNIPWLGFKAQHTRTPVKLLESSSIPLSSQYTNTNANHRSTGSELTTSTAAISSSETMSAKMVSMLRSGFSKFQATSSHRNTSGAESTNPSSSSLNHDNEESDGESEIVLNFPQKVIITPMTDHPLQDPQPGLSMLALARSTSTESDVSVASSTASRHSGSNLSGDESSSTASMKPARKSSSASSFISNALGQLTANVISAAATAAARHASKGGVSPGKKLGLQGSASEIFDTLATDSQRCQQQIVNVHRLLQEAKENHAIGKTNLAAIKVDLDEASEWKKRLCDQFQLLVEDANRGRKQKLQFLTESFMI
jgi:hypothetical protein